MKVCHATVIFTDIRGFSKWSERSIEAFRYVERFIRDFYEILNKYVDCDFLKKLGDGAFIVREHSEEINMSMIIQELKVVLDMIYDVETNFSSLCNEFSNLYGYRTNLRLGWGVVRGVIKQIEDDYMGSNINKCAHYCSVAKPFGLIIDQDDFAYLPAECKYDLQNKTVHLKGLEEVNLWITKEIFDRFNDILKEAKNGTIKY